MKVNKRVNKEEHIYEAIVIKEGLLWLKGGLCQMGRCYLLNFNLIENVYI